MTALSAERFAATITGYLAGALRLANEPTFRISVETPRDADGNYTNQIVVIGRSTGQRVLITVEVQS